MIIIPAIDLPHPDHSRLGESRIPRDVINEWEWAGFQSVHIVEPDSTERRPLNRRQAEELLRDVRQMEAQVAGDIHSADDIEALIDAGAARIVLGARAIDEPDWLASTVSAFPGTLIVESTAHERRVRSRGWIRTRPIDVRDLADEISDLPLAGLLLTFPDDASIETPDLALVEDLTDRLPFPLMIGGGNQTLASLRDLEFRGVHATIITAAKLVESFDEQTLAHGFLD